MIDEERTVLKRGQSLRKRRSELFFKFCPYFAVFCFFKSKMFGFMIFQNGWLLWLEREGVKVNRYFLIL